MKNSWINVNDKLPGDRWQYVLVYTESGDFDLCWYNEIDKHWYWNGFDKIEEQVTHWQPLVKP